MKLQLRREVIDTVLLVIVGSVVRSVLGRDDEEGQGLAEYALILALIAIVSIVALIYLGGQISQRLSQVGDAL